MTRLLELTRAHCEHSSAPMTVGKPPLPYLGVVPDA